MATYPLIRKKHTLIGTLKGIVKMIKSKGEVTKRTPLVIPKSNDFERAEFISLFNGKSSQLAQEKLPTNSAELVTLVKKYNIQGKGGAAYPMDKKLDSFSKVKKEDKVLIINATECDPGLLHDQWIANNHYKEIIKTVELLKRLYKIDKVYLATKYQIDSNNWPGIEIVKMPNIYPIGAEKAVIRTILGVEPFTYKYPIELGVLVQNIQTIFTLHNLLFDMDSFHQHFLTYKDFKSDKSYIVSTTVGSNLSDITDGLETYVGGGIMQGRKAEPNETVSHSTNFLATGKVPGIRNSKCKKCKQCTSHCPLGLDVHFAANDKMDKTEASKCVKCGSCSYICPSGIDLCSNIQKIAQ